jgi:hypothetical protein
MITAQHKKSVERNIYTRTIVATGTRVKKKQGILTTGELARMSREQPKAALYPQKRKTLAQTASFTPGIKMPQWSSTPVPHTELNPERRYIKELFPTIP